MKIYLPHGALEKDERKIYLISRDNQKLYIFFGAIIFCIVNKNMGAFACFVTSGVRVV